ASEARPLIEKPGLLTADEKKLLNNHPIVGAALFEQVRSLRRAAEFVRAHHERMDGRGYPAGLPAGDIPLGARILCACDSFDAMTSDRPYIRARSAAEALAELRRGSGSQFDPRVAESFCRLFEGGRLGEIFLGSRRSAAGPPARAAAAPSPAAAPIAAH